jgi:hypothetical protein
MEQKIKIRMENINSNKKTTFLFNKIHYKNTKTTSLQMENT